MDRTLEGLKNNRVLAFIVIVGIVVIGIADVTEAVDKIGSFVGRAFVGTTRSQEQLSMTLLILLAGEEANTFSPQLLPPLTVVSELNLLQVYQRKASWRRTDET